mmetsp:Transcript_24008/g.44062  ORF Transcript_24008/g.44062 Transcript_24008/m.44062 type:complete len:371 (-) Transcript_24008:5902-7014(-)
MACAVFERFNFGIDCRVSIKQVIEFQKVSFIGHDLLHPHRPLLIPGARQAKGFIPSWQLHRTRAGLFRQGHGQHLNQNAVDVVFGLLFRQAQRIDLHAITEAAEFRIADAIARLANLVPQIDEGTHFAHLGDKSDACIHKERNATHHGREISWINARLQFVQNGRGCGKRESQFLFRGRASLLQVIGTHVHGVPFRNVRIAVFGHVRDHLKAGFRRANIGSARQVFLDQIVLHSALQGCRVRALFLGHRNIKRQEPRGRRIDRHRRIHLLQRNVLKEAPHIAQMRNGYADFAHFAARQDVIAVISGLRWQIKGDAQPGLPFGQVGTVERVGRRSGGVTGIGADQPGAVFLGHRNLAVRQGNKITFCDWYK